jgi:hypothetical protein
LGGAFAVLAVGIFISALVFLVEMLHTFLCWLNWDVIIICFLFSYPQLFYFIAQAIYHLWNSFSYIRIKRLENRIRPINIYMILAHELHLILVVYTRPEWLRGASNFQLKLIWCN